MMRLAILALALMVLAAPLATSAQQPVDAPRIGYLDSGSPPGIPPVTAFQEGLRELGYIEGQNITIEYRWADGRYEQLPNLSADLVRLNVKVIFAGGTPAALAAKRATATIPIVIGFVGDPVASGLVASLARPGGNVTGWTPEPGLELTAKRLEGLRDVVPGVTRVGLLWNPAKPIHESALKAVQAAARTLGIQLQPVGVRDAKELESQFQVVVTARTQALYVLPDGKFLSQRKRMMDLAIENRLPVAGGTREYAVAGALMAYAANLVDLHRRTAYFVDRILKGVKPADLPAERPTRFELVVNLKTAKALGLSIPQSLLLRADEVIQ